jgi:hypothetical protein
MPDQSLTPIRNDYLSGMSYVAIGKKYGIDPRTAKRYALKNLPNEFLEQRPFPSVLDQYKPMINMWLENGKLPSTVIHDRLVEMGCVCGYTIVNDYVQKIITEYEKTGTYQVYVQSKRVDKDHNSGSFKERQMQKVSIEKARFIRGGKKNANN